MNIHGFPWPISSRKACCRTNGEEGAQGVMIGISIIDVNDDTCGRPICEIHTVVVYTKTVFQSVNLNYRRTDRTEVRE